MANIDNYFKVTERDTVRHAERDNIVHAIQHLEFFDSKSVPSVVSAASRILAFQSSFGRQSNVAIYRRLDVALEARVLTAAEATRPLLESIRCVIPCEESGHSHQQKGESLVCACCNRTIRDR